MPEPQCSAADHAHMAEALRLAERGLFTTMPNPRVGCVIVREGQVVGRGWHERAGEAHAEIHALREAADLARGATVYVSLEPCSHYGRTPPCAEALIAAGARRVVVAMTDPNPLVAGRGIARLRAAGIAVSVGLLREEALALNVGFVARMRRGRPWLRLKIAASLDGRTALANGESQWITGAEARADGHRWRARACAILTGIGTARRDDPRLTVRGVAVERKPPLKVIVDPRLELSPTARLFDGGPVLVVSAREDAERALPLQEKGAEWIALPEADGTRVDLAALLRELGRREINEVHGEAGAGLNGAFLASGLADELLLYLAPCLLGSGQGMFRLPELDHLDARHPLAFREVTQIGADLRILASCPADGDFMNDDPATG
ncbi:MAG: bifunctional diaminohydroxyphosphoribosylaminopyrimidine deaminase/5-amino-6-(5-phosphoribosylamino)uracil reductase RibD [Zoogloeaceae bacterium]|nr:bifunctional diaminohydroxyphosphoribosylaminopyrimidine deaminase/5-amino-6-(5-phosphoribosylamino)uracil reductase RibD [Zoogloeaceae bacterium]